MKDKSQSREQRADPVLLQLFIVLPIMLVRILYATSQAFKSTPQNPTHNTWVYLVLLMIPDFISDAVYTYFGAVILRSFKHSGPSKGQPSSEYGKMSSSQTQQPAYQEPPY
jgi:hypothetical protein